MPALWESLESTHEQRVGESVGTGVSKTDQSAAGTGVTAATTASFDAKSTTGKPRRRYSRDPLPVLARPAAGETPWRAVVAASDRYCSVPAEDR
jgi:hypothetical protein